MGFRSIRAALLLAFALCMSTAVAAGGLIKTDTVIGKGKEAVPGAMVQVNYSGWLYDAKAADKHGAKFDSSIGRGPFSFPLGAGRVIKGWDQGVAGMAIGEVRKLTIPPGMGYGARGFPPVIPPNSTLVFEVELLGLG